MYDLRRSVSSLHVLSACCVLGCAGAFIPRPAAVARERPGTAHDRLDRRRSNTANPVDRATHRVLQQCAALPSDGQLYKVVTAWRYDGSAVEVPWRALGDVLFEMGAPWVSVESAHGSPAGREGGRARAHEEHGASVEDRGRERAVLTFAVGGGRDVGAALEAACALSGATSCFETLDWEEDPVESVENWEATASSDGFETVTIGKLRICPVQRYEEVPPGLVEMRLLEGQGWGDGEHPSTWMCLDFLEKEMKGGEREVVDYGTGSGVLATAAALLGARHVTAIDLDVEILTHARQNFLVNGVGGRVTALHTREVSIGDLSGEVVVVNMMAGPMLTLLATLVLAVEDGGVLCLSGLRPSDVPVVKREFGRYMDWDAGLEAARTVPAWGQYVRLVGRPKGGLATGGNLRTALERDLSEVAVA